MFEITGGILIAVAIMVFLPYILSGLAVVIGTAVAAILPGAATFFIAIKLGVEPGSAIVLAILMGGVAGLIVGTLMIKESFE